MIFLLLTVKQFRPGRFTIQHIWPVMIHSGHTGSLCALVDCMVKKPCDEKLLVCLQVEFRDALFVPSSHCHADEQAHEEHQTPREKPLVPVG